MIISIPRELTTVDEYHFQHVTSKVWEWSAGEHRNIFLKKSFTENKIGLLQKYLRDNAALYDDLTTEHLIHSVEPIVHLLTSIFNRIIKLEYIPVN